MPDKSDLTIPELKRRAVELRLQGIRPKEISEILDSGHSPWVIGLWLRLSKTIPKTRDWVLELSAEQKSSHDIAKIVRISVRRVQGILQEARGTLRPRNTTDQNIDRFLSDPERHMKARFTQSEPFGWALIKRCEQEVARNPLDALETVVPSKKLLDRIRQTRRKEWTQRRALCLYVQIQGTETRIYQVTNRHEIAVKKLQAAYEEANGCVPCEAFHLWRFCIIYWTWNNKWDQAHAALNGSIDRYRSLGNSGHDLLGNGLANCQVLKSGLSYYTVSPEVGAVEARKGLSMLTGTESPILFRNLTFALAKCLQPSRNPRDVQESRELLQWCFEILHMRDECSIARAMLYWLRGHLASVDGKEDNALEDFTLALEDAQELELGQEVSAILSDIGTLRPDPREIRNHIEDFCDWNDAGDLIVPAWCENLQQDILSVYDVSLHSRGRIEPAVFSNLRDAAGGENLMPALIIPSQMTQSSTAFRVHP